MFSSLKNKLLFYPDKRLREISQPVDMSQQHAEIAELNHVLRATMMNNHGLGLSAIQIGVPLNVFVMHPDAESLTDDPICLINPRIVERDNKTKQVPEGCLSIPGLIVVLARPQKILVEYEDLQGQKQVEEFVDIISVCVQHELDHCQGRLILDYLRKNDLDIVQKYYDNPDFVLDKKLIKELSQTIFEGHIDRKS